MEGFITYIPVPCMTTFILWQNVKIRKASAFSYGTDLRQTDKVSLSFGKYVDQH